MPPKRFRISPLFPPVLKFPRVRDQLYGSSPPSVFVGRVGYPDVMLYPAAPPETGDTSVYESPREWLGMPLERFLALRLSLYRGSARVRVEDALNPPRALQDVQLLSLSREPVDVELKFAREPRGVYLDERAPPMGPAAPLLSLRLCGEPKLDRAVERAYGDRDLKAHYAALTGRRVAVVATAGLRGTINVLAVLQIEPDLRALADAFRLAVEAKAVAAADLGLRRGGRRVGGDVSDAVAVIATGGERRRYVGLGTDVGEELFELAHEAVIKALGGLDADCELRLNLGLGYDDLLNLVLDAYYTAPAAGAGNVERLARSLLDAVLADPNVWAYIYAAGELDARGAVGTLRGLSRDEHRADSKKIVADESIGAALAEYIGGFKAVLALYWLDRLKPGPLSRLPMFADDIAAAIAAGVLARLYDRLLHGL